MIDIFKTICFVATLTLTCKQPAKAPPSVTVAPAVAASTACTYTQVPNNSCPTCVDLVLTGNCTAADLFVNAAAGDFHLAASMPTIGAGLCLPEVTIDKDGNPRPTPGRPPGMGCDVGPYQFIGAPNLQPLPAPTGLMGNCSADGKSLTATWNAVSTATDYWPRALFTDDGSFIPEGTKDGGNPATSISFPVASGREVRFWVHGFNILNPPADPTWPMGVGNYSEITITCNATLPGPPSNLRLGSIQK